MKTATAPIPENGFICCACAERLGGKWPDDHLATMHHGECQVCGLGATLSNVGDWDWPDDRPRGMRG